MAPRRKSRDSEEKPRGRTSAYIFYTQSCWRDHRASNPDVHFDREAFRQFTKDISERWREMSVREKRRFQTLADEDKKRYDQQMGTYRAAVDERKKSQPKRPLSAYFWFIKDERPKVCEEMPDASVTEVAKELGRRWTKCTSTERAKYEALSAKDRARYAKQRDAALKAKPHEESNKDEKNGKNKAINKNKAKQDLPRNRSASRSLSASSGDDEHSFDED